VRRFPRVALSHEGRAFFYAGARALLVSHWSVDSAATVKLITSAVDTITRDKTVGRADALRSAMLAMIDKGEPREAKGRPPDPPGQLWRTLMPPAWPAPDTPGEVRPSSPALATTSGGLPVRHAIFGGAPAAR
jgi:CHAT domain-containing protein